MNGWWETTASTQGSAALCAKSRATCIAFYSGERGKRSCDREFLFAFADPPCTQGQAMPVAR